MSDDAPPASEIANRLPRYLIKAEIGRGGMGVVYAAEDMGPLRRKRVALKVLEPRLANEGKFRQRFEAEAQLVANLVHPNVLPIYDFGEAGGLLYLVMHYVDGSDLWRLLEQQGPLRPDHAARIFTQVAGALDAAHRQGLVHRDVKPGNVLIERPGAAEEHTYLTDFGITKNIASGESLTATGQFVGTVDYIAPEQIEGHVPLDGRADVYSLGAMVFECLSGEVPYPRETDMQRLFAHLQDEPPSLRGIRPELAGTVDGVLRKAMAKDRGDRYATCGEMAADLEEALLSAARRRSAVTTPPPPAPSPPPEVPPAPAAPPPSSGGRRARRLGLVVGGLVVAAALAVAGTLAVLSGEGGGVTTRDVIVDGTKSWSDTRVNLDAGDQVNITAAGSVFHNEAASIGPEGFPNRPDLLTPLDRANHAGLLARVGDTGEAFYVGRGTSFTADRDGRLFLGINDGGLENNRGFFTATIEVRRD